MAFVLGIPFFAKSVPWRYEVKLADYVGDLPDMQVCNAPEGKAAFKKIIDRLYPVMDGDKDLPISVEIVKGKDVNAFASLGGKIYVFEGLIKQAESGEELAGVLAHEIEHVRHRHIIQGVFIRLLTVEAVNLALGRTGGMDPKLFSMLLNMRFGREQEEEADVEGLNRLQKAKIDVSGFRKFFERIENQTSLPAILSDHPSPENRAELTKKYDGSPIVPILREGEWMKIRKICSH